MRGAQICYLCKSNSLRLHSEVAFDENKNSLFLLDDYPCNPEKNPYDCKMYDLLGFYCECVICDKYILSNQFVDLIEKEKITDQIISNVVYKNLIYRSDYKDSIIFWFSNKEDMKYEVGMLREILEINKNYNFKIKTFQAESIKYEFINHARKKIEIMKYISEKIRFDMPFKEFSFTLKDIYLLKISSSSELKEWMISLMRDGLVTQGEYELYKNSFPSFQIKSSYYDKIFEKNIIDNSTSFSITPAGWSFIEKEFSRGNSNKAFIAMKFSNTPEINFEWEEIKETIKEACIDTGWNADIVNMNHNEDINDEIIANINEAKFVISEFTGNNHGAYFESGYAKGKGIPVIYVAHEKCFNPLNQNLKLHFDTNHINHVQWKDLEDLKKNLIFRIKSTIGTS